MDVEELMMFTVLHSLWEKRSSTGFPPPYCVLKVVAMFGVWSTVCPAGKVYCKGFPLTIRTLMTVVIRKVARQSMPCEKGFIKKDFH